MAISYGSTYVCLGKAWQRVSAKLIIKKYVERHTPTFNSDLSGERDGEDH